MRIYISGPISDNENYIEDFYKANKYLKQKYKDAVIINPSRMNELFYPAEKISHEEYMDMQ